jgi:hypothetical protein
LRLHDDATTDFLDVIGGLMGSIFHLVNNMLGLPWLASVASTQETGWMKQISSPRQLSGHTPEKQPGA